MAKKSKKRQLNEGEATDNKSIVKKTEDGINVDLPKKKKLKTNPEEVAVVKSQEVKNSNNVDGAENASKKSKKKKKKKKAKKVMFPQILNSNAKPTTVHVSYKYLEKAICRRFSNGRF